MSLKKLNIPLVKDTIDFEDIKHLISWLETNPRLTKGNKTIEFEKKWSEWLGVKYSIFVNSGSSANLAMIYSLLLSGKLKNKKIVVPSLSWVTSVSPLINFNLEPILCDSDSKNLSIDLIHLEQIFIKDNPAALMLIHPLGFPNDMNQIIDLCNKYDVIILEDSCETMGSKYGDKLMGTFGLISTFSFYFGHHMSVSPDTPIPFIDENNNFQIEHISYIYDKYEKNISDIQILTFDRQKYNTFYKSPNKILKHKFDNKKIYKITLDNGRCVEITEDHSVFSYDKEKFDIFEKRGKELSVGDYIVVPNVISKPNIKTNLNFIEFCKKYVDNFFVINHDDECYNNIKIKYDTKEYKQINNWKTRKVLPLEYLNNNIENVKIAIKNTPREVYIPIKYELNEEMCRLIGYFIAEGSYKEENSIVFTFNIIEEEYISDVIDIIYIIFGLESKKIIDVENNSCTINVYSSTVYFFFKYFMNIDSGAKNKRIPKCIFESNEKCIGSFLYGYFSGDGTSYKNIISVSSVSKKLINEISYLCSMINIGGRLTISDDSDKRYYIKDKLIKSKNIQYKYTLTNVNFSKNGDIIKNSKYIDKKMTFPISRYSKRNVSIVEYKYNEYVKLFKNDISENLKTFVNSDLKLIVIKKIEEIKPDYEYVYDFSVPFTENFVGGWQPICLHNSTIEGGMICTDDEDLYKIILSIRSHGWDRDLPKDEQDFLRKKYNIDDFRALYTFYYPGFNLRSTDLQAYIGISQMDKLEDIGIKRENNLKLYDKYIKNDYWKIQLLDNCFISNFAYPIIHPKVIEIHNVLKEYNVETRPLICGSMGKQPFWIERYGKVDLPFADIIHKEGMYLPNNPTMTEEDIKSICEIVNKIIN